MLKWLVAFAVVAALGGCVKMDKNPPKDMPAYVRLYPGSHQMMSMDLGMLASDVITTTSSPDDVVTWYRTQATSDGLSETAIPPKASDPADQKQAEFIDQASGRMLVVVAKPQNSETVVSLTYKAPTKAPS